MAVQGHRLRLIHVLLVIAWVAVGYVVMPFWGASFFAIGSVLGCLAVGFDRVPVAELFVMMVCLFVFSWYVSNAVERAKTPTQPALQRRVALVDKPKSPDAPNPHIPISNPHGWKACSLTALVSTQATSRCSKMDCVENCGQPN
ncbi:hypothetical protein BH23PLA1_BH23PLA1_42350 [soil metagenome]